jgi:hypothetical protein
MFEDDYLELLGIVDPAGFTNNLDRLPGGARRGACSGSALARATPRHARGLGRRWPGARGTPRPRAAAGGRGGALDLRFRNVMLGTTRPAA